MVGLFFWLWYRTLCTTLCKNGGRQEYCALLRSIFDLQKKPPPKTNDLKLQNRGAIESILI